PLLGFEGGGRETFRIEGGLVGWPGELPAHLEGRQGTDLFGDPLITDAIAGVRHVLAQHAVDHEAVEHTALQFPLQFRTDQATQLLPLGGQAVLVDAVELDAGNLLAIHPRRIVGAGRREIAGTEGQRERYADQDDYRDRDPTRKPISDRLQHKYSMGRIPITWNLRPKPPERMRIVPVQKRERGHLVGALSAADGGVEGTRPRGPRRDRPVF